MEEMVVTKQVLLLLMAPPNDELAVAEQVPVGI